MHRAVSHLDDDDDEPPMGGVAAAANAAVSGATRKRRRIADEDEVVPHTTPVVTTSFAALNALMEEGDVDDEDEVQIIDTPQPPPRQRLRIAPSTAVPARALPSPGSPLAPPLSPMSEPRSPLAPPMSPVSAATRALETRNMDEEEAAAVSRARRKALLEAKAAATAGAAASSSGSVVAVGVVAPTNGLVRRRKVGNAAAASSFASASLLHSYSGFTATNSSVPATLLWHEEGSVVVPTNAAERMDIERTLLQQVLSWDPHTPSPLDTRRGGGGKGKSPAKEKPTKELASFARFLDLDTPLPVHFSSPLAYLAYFGPVALDNFRSQLTQTAEENMPVMPGAGGDRHRSCWTVMNLQGLGAAGGGGDDWFEARFRLAQAHRSIGQLCGADIIVLGLDVPAPPVTATAATAHAPNASSPHLQPLAPPSAQTVYVLAFLERVEPDGSNCYCRVRLYLPGVSSALSSFVAPSSSASISKSRFQVFFNRLQQAVNSASNPIEEGSKNTNANFTPLGARSTATADAPIHKPHHLFLARLDTSITTMREYTALIKVACLLPLRLQHELLRPSPGDDADEDEVIDVCSPSSEVAPADDDGPPALESLDQVVKKQVVKARPRNSPSPRGDKLAHLDSPAWMGLPPGFRHFLQTTLNDRQLKAVQVALKRYEKPGFTLLQGPPGTGKSKTVVALLNSLHLGAFQRHYDSLIAHVVEGHPIIPKPRILVCAPSNTAVDELITRVVDAATQAPKSIDLTLPPDLQLIASLKGVGGFVDGASTRYRPDIVRVGHTDSIRAELKSSISLDALVDTYHRMSETDLQNRLVNARSYIASMERHLVESVTVYVKSRRLFQEMKGTLDALVALGHDVRNQPQYATFDRLRADFLARQSEVAHASEKRLQALQDVDRCELALRFKNAGRTPGPGGVRKERESAMDALRISFLNSAQIVFCTLSGSGLELLGRLDQPFKALIIDEAAQSTEISILIPLIHDVQHCILVGDPRQLPATVFSLDTAAKRMWERSLFERLEQSGHQMHSLTTQYRMHGDIRQFPSDYFYQGQLRDAEFIRTGTSYKRPYHLNSDFQPLLFYDLQSTSARTGRGGEDSAVSRSLGNAKEATFVVDLLSALLQQFPGAVNPKQIGIVTFYQKQKLLLQDELKRRAELTTPLNNTSVTKGPAAAAGSAAAAAAAPVSPYLSIEVSTVDGFQGREKEIIVVSCVRGGATGGLGFVDDVRRMNVALTRAKHALWVVGDSRALSRSAHWSAFLDSVAKRHRFQPAAGEEFAAYRPRPPQQQQQQPQQQHQRQQFQPIRQTPQHQQPQLQHHPNQQAGPPPHHHNQGQQPHHHHSQQSLPHRASPQASAALAAAGQRSSATPPPGFSVVNLGPTPPPPAQSQPRNHPQPFN